MCNVSCMGVDMLPGYSLDEASCWVCQVFKFLMIITKCGVVSANFYT